jgi:hypothetical protein
MHLAAIICSTKHTHRVALLQNRFREAAELFQSYATGCGAVQGWKSNARPGVRALLQEVGQQSEIALGSFVSRPAAPPTFCEASKCQHPAVQTAQEIY